MKSGKEEKERGWISIENTVLLSLHRVRISTRVPERDEGEVAKLWGGQKRVARKGVEGRRVDFFVRRGVRPHDQEFPL